MPPNAVSCRHQLELSVLQPPHPRAVLPQDQLSAEEASRLLEGHQDASLSHRPFFHAVMVVLDSLSPSG